MFIFTLALLYISLLQYVLFNISTDDESKQKIFDVKCHSITIWSLQHYCQHDTFEKERKLKYATLSNFLSQMKKILKRKILHLNTLDVSWGDKIYSQGNSWFIPKLSSKLSHEHEAACMQLGQSLNCILGECFRHGNGRLSVFIFDKHGSAWCLYSIIGCLSSPPKCTQSWSLHCNWRWQHIPYCVCQNILFLINEIIWVRQNSFKMRKHVCLSGRWGSDTPSVWMLYWGRWTHMMTIVFTCLCFGLVTPLWNTSEYDWLLVVIPVALPLTVMSIQTPLYDEIHMTPSFFLYNDKITTPLDGSP